MKNDLLSLSSISINVILNNIITSLQKTKSLSSVLMEINFYVRFVEFDVMHQNNTNPRI